MVPRGHGGRHCSSRGPKGCGGSRRSLFSDSTLGTADQSLSVGSSLPLPI